MVRIFSLLLIASALAFGGRAYAVHKENKARVISEVVAMINTVENRLRYSNVPVCRIFNEALFGERLGFVKKCIDKTNNGMGFHEAWKQSVAEDRSLKLLLGNFASFLMDFGLSLGVTDVEGQISECEYYKDIFTSELSQREEESRKCSKVFPQLGLLAGAFFLIFLI